tara:strand:+ start:769 stop:1065 length:297 start_codon:yes stop_codon:yes gene_type:complete
MRSALPPLARPVIDVAAIVSAITVKEVLVSILTVMDIHTMISEYYMWRAVEKDDKGVKIKRMGKRGGQEFVDTIFGADTKLQETEKLMTGNKTMEHAF